jgi:hypothetical protein
VSAPAQALPLDSQRAWWLRAVLVLWSPVAVFSALRDESREAVDARQEPVTALVFLAGIAGVLLAPAFGRIFDDFDIDALGLVVIVVFAGSIYGFFGYWLLGWMLSIGIRALQGEASSRRCRHVVAFATAPLVLSLIAVWPLRLALYGGDLFKSGGADSGTAGQVLRWACVAFAAWSAALLVVGVKAVQRWSWWRAVAASVFALGLAAAVLGVWAALAG